MEERIEGWSDIAKAFPCSYSTFIKKHSQEMLKSGFVFKSHVLRHTIKRTPVVWTFPVLIYAYMSSRQIKDGKV